MIETVRRNYVGTAALRIIASDGGKVDLSGLTQLKDYSDARVGGKISVSATGEDSLVDLSKIKQLKKTDITIEDTAGIDLGSLESFNDGTIRMASTDTEARDLHVADTFSLGSGATIEVAGSTAAVVVGPGTPSGAADGSLTVTSGGSLFGTGSIVGDLVNYGLVGPGNSPGTLIIDGDYEQLAGSTLLIEIAGESVFDTLDIGGQASILGGTLEISFLDGYLPKEGDTFEFLLADGGVSGSFDSFLCDNCGALDFSFDYGSNYMKLIAGSSTTVPLPGGIWLFGSALGLALALRRRLAS
ncbi:hypothetical protein D779_0686 [Imhoffiella purpurea]|uniref:Uncharacterized protein n=2 Tax=Imhoffiella purpurea TaxID=1249627 RepID=W9VJ25_9GAMM|nr:hypothetical protein D779_0686 [Imhoffiella purpurea]